MRTITFTSPDEIEEWRGRWDPLARSSGATFFQSTRWVEAWWRWAEPRATVHLLVDGPVEAPTGLLPLARLRRRLHPRVPLSLGYVGIAGSGFGAADALGPITADEESGRRLLAAALDVAGNAPLILDSVAPRHRDAAAGLPGAVELTSTPRPVLDLHPDVTTTWSAKLRKEIARRERRMTEAGLTRRWVRIDPTHVESLRHLERLHEQLWRSRGRAGLYGPRRRALLDGLASDDPSGEGPWLQLIERHDDVVAVLLGLRFGSTFCSYKTGWDPEVAAMGPGIALHSAAISWAAAAGLTRYDFLRGANSHKTRLGGREEFDTTFVVARGPKGRALLLRDRISVHRGIATAWPVAAVPAMEMSPP